MLSIRHAFRPTMAAVALVSAGSALAQGFPKGPMRSSDEATVSAGYRTVVVEMPLNVMAKESVGRVEFNLGGRASLAVEGMMKPKQDEVDDKTKKDTGESYVSQGRGGAVFVARYTDPLAMAGFFWGLGLGYRQEDVQWHVKADPGDRQVNMSLVDDTQRLSHDASLTGMTGHARVGYRYVGTEVPLLIGCYLGARHFQAGIRDEPVKDTGGDQPALAPMTDREKDKLRRRNETMPETAIELGFMF